ncbi:Alpha/Beta hydrolase protein [Halteromyces radiatus]|uniref:Alpha/Beta hydrolase protein n=1 Tax=Halteromyces radiatus TaxID=101107 RepID=UPI00221FFBD3|nr:Alpha/Beta hydrolase protein [Halteromyces radiatus]KAI8089707.1 Alpha/Beta hydrolase protein [Halteromyces radiatus]
MVEALFYLYFLATKQRLQAMKKPNHPMTRDQRTQLYWQCLRAIDDGESWCVGWFYYSHDISHPTFDQIQRENVTAWFSWAFWQDHVDHVKSNSEWAEELEWMVFTAEKHLNIAFAPGYNPSLQCIRLNLDPVQAVHRPLLLYIGIYLGTIIFNNIFLQWWWQFQVYGNHHIVWGGILHNLHQCLISLVTCQQQLTSSSISTPPKDQHIAYWYRASPVRHDNYHNSQDNSRTPLVFIHGIGAGLMGYAEFLYHLVGQDRPIFFVELPHVSMHMVDNVPEAQDMVKDIKHMLQDHGYEHAVFVSHSLGTAVTSWMMTYAPTFVAGTVLIDPICFLLHYPQVCFNFIHRMPKRIFEYVTFYGASRELYISHYISRHFQWFQCIYFADLMSNPRQQTNPLNNATVFLSEADGIVGSPMVYKYLTRCGVDCHLMPKLEHAGFLFNWTWRKRILEQIECVARNADDEGIDLRS